MEKRCIKIYKGCFYSFTLEGLNLSELTTYLETMMLNDNYVINVSADDCFDIYENVEETDEEFNIRISAEKNKKQKEEEQEILTYLKLKLKYENT